MPRLILIGPPGCGKSTVGAALAKKLSIEFIDTDSAIEVSYGHKISDIFVDKGEQFFRDLEFTTLTQSLSVSDCVLSLGGGAPIALRAQDLLNIAQAPIFFICFIICCCAKSWLQPRQTSFVGQSQSSVASTC